MTNQIKKKRSFPTAFTVLFIILVLAAIMTYIIPAGKYATLSYDEEKSVFVQTNPDGSTKELEDSQATLDKLGVNADIEKFRDGTLYKPMAISNTYVELPKQSQGVIAVILAPIRGIHESMDITLFILMLGGLVGVLNKLGAFNAGIAALSRKSKGREFIIIAVVTILISLGGTTFGMAEETIAFYPILIPIFLAAGYDAMVGIGAIYIGSTIGCMFSTVNPFSVVIASNAAGVNFKSGMNFRLIGLVIGTIICLVYIISYAKRIKKDPSKSVIFDQREHISDKFAGDNSAADLILTGRNKISLVLFAATFVVLVLGVSSWDWWFDELSALFLCSAILIAIVGGLSEKEMVSGFISGAGDLIGVALIVGVARAVNLILETGLVSDTILNSMTGWVEGMSPILFILIMFVVYIILGFFINSSSGLAVLSIPIMAPLADAVGLPREAVISAYIYGLGIMSFITPTGLILPSLELIDVTFDRWFKFCWPLILILTGFGALMLILQISFS